MATLPDIATATMTQRRTGDRDGAAAKADGAVSICCQDLAIGKPVSSFEPDGLSTCNRGTFALPQWQNRSKPPDIKSIELI